MQQKPPTIGALRRPSVRLGFASVLLGASSIFAIGQAAWAETATAAAPFSPPAALVLVPSDADVTGTVRSPETPGERLPIASGSPLGAAPAFDIAPPDLPQPPVIDSKPAALTTQDIETSLANWRGTGAPVGATAADLTKQRQATRGAIATFYQSRANAPLWIDGSHFSATARAAIARIERAGEDGLSLHGYPIPVLQDASGTQLAEAELALSEAIVAYARQAGGSRIDPLQINRLITAKRTLADVPDILSAVASAADPGAALQAFNPPQPGYAALRAKLAEVRQSAAVAQVGIPLGPTLKPGMRDARVPLIRSRFGLDAGQGDQTAEDLVYDTKVAGAVAAFQRDHGLQPSGLLTPRTITMLSGGNPVRLENELVANMERWRWVPRDLGHDHIMVNVPDFSLDLMHDGQSVHHARVVVGKPDHQTPIFSDTMRFIIVNPYWNVPLSIIKKEMLPRLAQDPNYFANHGYEVVQRNGITYVRQPPGEDNALGRIKFMFPNQHSVYLHDTNARALFGKDKRAFSHGCVRVDQPFALAEAVLGKDRGWTEKRIEKLVGGDERTINLPVPLPIHIAYFTAFVDGRNSLQMRDDVYGYSEKVKLALGLRD